MSLIENIQRLPEDVVQSICEYLPLRFQMMVNRNIYTKNHRLVRSWVAKNKYENYVRTMVCHDNDFVFHHILEENFDKWLYFKNYLYTDVEYIHYLYFLLDFSRENHSLKCYRLLKETLESHGLSQNQHKKNLRHSIWLPQQHQTVL